MGFWNGIMRMAQGKPVFENPAQMSEPDSAAELPEHKIDPTKTPVDERGYKIIPQIELSHLRTQRSGNEMTTTVWVTNTSEQLIRIDNSRLLEQEQVHGRELGPAQGHELTLYHGPVATSDHAHEAHIVYRLKSSGDVFEEEYTVEYSRESDGVFLPEELREDGPTRDM